MNVLISVTHHYSCRYNKDPKMGYVLAENFKVKTIEILMPL